MELRLSISSIQFRLAEFSRNLQAIEENNSDPESTHEMGVNKFSDWTKDEMKRILGYRPAPGQMEYHAANV